MPVRDTSEVPNDNGFSSQGVPIVAVMGLTGSGKSYLIAQVTGDTSITGASIESCTTAVTPYMAEVNGKKVILLDTPGFNDTQRSDAAILNLIADWVEATYRKKIPLSGVIYMHDISQERMTGSAVASIKIFRELCGEDFYKNIVFVSNMWHKTTEEAGHAKLAEVKDKFWGLMLKRGSAAVDFKGGMTAESIVSMIMKNTPAYTKLGQELVDDNKSLLETSAGQTANGELIRIVAKLCEQISALNEEHKRALLQKEEEMEDLVMQHKREYQKQIDQISSELEALNNRKPNVSGNVLGSFWDVCREVLWIYLLNSSNS